MDSFDRLAEDWQRSQRVASFSIAVLRGGTLIYAAGFGAATPETIYQSASLGKHFTAALALLLSASAEAPRLDSPIGQHLPEWKGNWADITLRHLLSHTGGVPEAGYNSLDQARDYTDAEIVHAISLGGHLDFSPGTAWSYSNAGYVLAGIAISRAAGAFYGDLLNDWIFIPLEMTTASVNAPGAPVGYIRLEGSWVTAASVSPTLNRLADGGLCLSVLDFARWESALSGDWGIHVAEMFIETPVRGESCGYGLGWFLNHSDRGRVAEHEGSWQGFSTAMVRYLDEGLSAVVLANQAECDVAGLAHTLTAAARA